MKTEITDGDDFRRTSERDLNDGIEDLESRIHDRIGGRKDCFML